MNDSRCRNEATRVYGDGGRASGGPDRAGPYSRGQGGVWGRMLAVLAGLVLVGLGSGGRAQEPDAPAPGAPAAGAAQPLSLRYRFSEKYGVAEDPNRPDLLGQYQVGVLETIRFETEKAQGAPDRTGYTYRLIYTERPAKTGRNGDVTDAVRRYDRYDLFHLGGSRHADPRAAGFFKDLVLWYRLRPGTVPELISLTPDRPIREHEYTGIQGVVNQLFVPRLKAAVLPLQAVRVEDTWPIERQAAQALLGNLPEAGDFDLQGRLVKVEKAAEGTTLTATIDISGELALDEGDGAVRARILFVFEPPPAAPPGEPNGPPGRPGEARTARDAGLVDARGYIAKVQMSRRLATPLEDNPRLQRVLTREIDLHRRRVGGQSGGAQAAPLTIPDPPPKADETNSWILYDDPQGRFHFRHPQELAIEVLQPERIEMTYARPGGGLDALIVLPGEKQRDPQRDRQFRDPQSFVRELKDAWLRNGHEVVMGETGFLPDADWAPRKRKVYRVESAIKPKQEALGGRNVARFYLDAYLVLFERNECIRLEAVTDRENHVVLRDQAEGLLRSLELGPSAPGMGGAAAPPDMTDPTAAPPASGRPARPPAPPAGGRP